MKQKVTKKTMAKASVLIGAGLTHKETRTFLQLSSATIHRMVKAEFDHGTYREMVREASAKAKDSKEKYLSIRRATTTTAQNGAIKTGTTTAPTETLEKVRIATGHLFDLLTEMLVTTKT